MSIASTAAGNSKKNEDEKMPLRFGDVEITSDLWTGCFCGALRAAGRLGVYPVRQDSAYAT